MSYSGYLIIFDEANRSRELEDYYIRNGWTFSDTLSLPDWQVRKKEFCFLSFDNSNINYAALAIRKRTVATKKVRVDFMDFVAIDPISFEEIENAIRKQIRPYFTRITSNNYGGRFPQATWDEIFNLVIRLRPDVADQLRRLEKTRATDGDYLSGHGYEIVAQEKDAIDLAFKLFSPDYAIPKLPWSTPDDNEIAPFLKGITDPIVTEDLLINHDANVFGDWEEANRYKVGAIEYSNGREKLTIVNCNRTKIEDNLGVDLIYYHHKYDSFVLVQYKKMILGERKFRVGKDKAEEANENRLAYRPIDKSYKKEVETIRCFLESHPYHSTLGNLTEFRLLSNGFFFKLCEVEKFTPSNQDLIKGMYIPYNYWEKLLQSEEAKGPRGGIAIGYHNVERYFNNTLFIDLVANGWIGTTGLTSDDIHSILMQSLDQNKSVMIAYTESI